MAFTLRKMMSSRHSLKKKDPKSTFTLLSEADDAYAAHSTDPDDIEIVKKAAYDDRRARQAEEYLAKHGFAGVIGGGALRGLR